jgi:hypothetical protein
MRLRIEQYELKLPKPKSEVDVSKRGIDIHRRGCRIVGGSGIGWLARQVDVDLYNTQFSSVPHHSFLPRAVLGVSIKLTLDHARRYSLGRCPSRTSAWF